MSEELLKRVERVLRKLYCRIHSAPPGRTEVEVELLQNAEELIGDLKEDLEMALGRQVQLERERRNLKNALRYRDRVITDLRSR